MQISQHLRVILLLIISLVQIPFLINDAQGGEKGILYVPMGPGKKVIAIDLVSDKIIKTIPVKPETHGLAVTKDGKELYVPSMKNFRTIFVYEAKAGKELAAIEVGGPQHHVRVSPDGRFAYATIMPSSVAVIDTSTRKLIKAVPVGVAPDSVAFTPDSRFAYITNSEDDTVSVIDTEAHKVVATIDVGELPDHVTISPDGKRAFVTNNFSEDISVIDTATNKVIKTIPAGKGTHGIAISPDGKLVIASNRGGTTYTVVDAINYKPLKSVEVGREPEHVSILKVGAQLKMYLNLLGAHQILVIDPETDEVLRRLDVGVDPHAHAVYIPKK